MIMTAFFFFYWRQKDPPLLLRQGREERKGGICGVWGKGYGMPQARSTMIYGVSPVGRKIPIPASSLSVISPCST